MKETQYQYPKFGHQGVRLKEKNKKDILHSNEEWNLNYHKILCNLGFIFLKVFSLLLCLLLPQLLWIPCIKYCGTMFNPWFNKISWLCG
jgi:hypothetical protein